MRKALIISLLSISFSLYAAQPGDMTFNLAPGMGNNSDQNLKVIGGSFNYFLTDSISAGTLIEWYTIDQSIGTSKYRFSYLPIALTAQYHIASESLSGSLFGGAGLFYAPNISSKDLDNPGEVDFLDFTGLLFQLGYSNTSLLGSGLSLDIYLEYHKNLSYYSQKTVGSTTTSYSYDMMLIKIGVGFNFSTAGNEEK